MQRRIVVNPPAQLMQRFHHRCRLRAMAEAGAIKSSSPIRRFAARYTIGRNQLSRGDLPRTPPTTLLRRCVLDAKIPTAALMLRTWNPARAHSYSSAVHGPASEISGDPMQHPIPVSRDEQGRSGAIETARQAPTRRLLPYGGRVAHPQLRNSEKEGRCRRLTFLWDKSSRTWNTYLQPCRSSGHRRTVHMEAERCHRHNRGLVRNWTGNLQR